MMVSTVMMQLLPHLQTLQKLSVFKVNVVKPWNFMLIRGKQTLDFSKVPILLDEELEEEFVRGSGPGGSNVNKTSNAVVLKHKPTGIIIKCHQSRSLHKNRELAKEMLIVKLDNLLNGDLSVEAQKQKMLDKKSKERSSRAEKIKNLKEEWKQRENIE
jgi:protein subunit release factor B